MSPLEVFYCYAHEDQTLRSRLDIYLSGLKREGKIIIWYDRKISPGMEWQQSIEDHLNTADLILLLVSPYFIASDYCYGVEMKRALERHHLGEARVVPIILRPVDWSTAPFRKLQALPQDGKPITLWRRREEAFHEVANGIRRVLEELQASSDVMKAIVSQEHETATVASKRELERQYSSRTLGQPAPGRIFPPQTADERYIQQRGHIVQEIYTLLVSRDITAVALTGVGGVGKSTLGALVLNYSEDLRLIARGRFVAEPIWLRIEPAMTMSMLVENLSEAVGKPLPDLKTQSPRNMALTLLEVLDTLEQPRLVIFDQFENLLDWQTGQALPNRPGVDELIDLLNSQKCASRILLTSRSIPRGIHTDAQTYLQTYVVEGISDTEGRELLRKQGVITQQAADDDLLRVTHEVKGHALALTLIASILRHNRSLKVNDLFTSPLYTSLWVENIAENLLDYIYKEQLDALQRKLLQAFSVYREPSSLESALVFFSGVSKKRLFSALDVLLGQHLLHAVGEGRYQLHPIITTYVQHQISRRGETAKRGVHIKAAQYYMNYAVTACIPSGKRRKTSDVQAFIEAIWHRCQAGQWQEAYQLLEQEDLFTDLRKWGNNVTLLELYQLLLPMGRQSREFAQSGHIYERVATLYFVIGQAQRALELFEMSLAAYKQAGSYHKQASILTRLGETHDNMGEKKQARVYFEQAVQAYDRTDDDSGKGEALTQLAGICQYDGELPQALEYIEQALQLFQQGPVNYRGTALAFCKLGSIYHEKKKFKEAQESFERALRLFNQVSSRGMGAWTLGELASIHEELDQNEQARIFLEEALRIFREVRDRRGEAWILNDLGKFYTKLALFDRAQIYLEEALHIFHEIGEHNGQGIAYYRLGYWCQSQEQHIQAMRHYEKAWSLQEKISDLRGGGHTLLNVAILFLNQDDHDGALASFLLSKEYFAKVQSPDGNKVFQWMDTLKQKIGEPEFILLQASVEPHAQQLVKQKVHEVIIE